MLARPFDDRSLTGGSRRWLCRTLRLAAWLLFARLRTLAVAVALFMARRAGFGAGLAPWRAVTLAAALLVAAIAA
ncbi:MAG: hypothetical protein Q8O70_06825, partial [Burkholderiales bacterium]|nr:hypothetical protein [Burkholderiales bacterium]